MGEFVWRTKNDLSTSKLWKIDRNLRRFLGTCSWEILFIYLFLTMEIFSKRVANPTSQHSRQQWKCRASSPQPHVQISSSSSTSLYLCLQTSMGVKTVSNEFSGSISPWGCSRPWSSSPTTSSPSLPPSDHQKLGDSWRQWRCWHHQTSQLPEGPTTTTTSSLIPSSLWSYIIKFYSGRESLQVRQIQNRRSWWKQLHLQI